MNEMDFTRKNLDAAIQLFMPGSDTWKVDRITLAKMVAVDLFCFPDKVTDDNRVYSNIIRVALSQLKIDGQLTFMSEDVVPTIPRFKVGDMVVRCNGWAEWHDIGYYEDDATFTVDALGVDESALNNIRLRNSDGLLCGWWAAKNFKKI